MRILGVAAGLAFMTACGGGDDGGGDAAAGEAIFTATGSCSGCHGADGTQGTVIGQEPNQAPAADLTVRVPALTDAEITDQVQNGGAVMPAQTQVTAEQMPDLIAYLREQFPGAE